MGGRSQLHMTVVSVFMIQNKKYKCFLKPAWDRGQEEAGGVAGRLELCNVGINHWLALHCTVTSPVTTITFL